jgi:rhodanese-related sulfurtransferase
LGFNAEGRATIWVAVVYRKPGEESPHEERGETTMPTADDGVPSISVREAAERLAQPDADVLLLDVREADEYGPRRVRGAVNIPMSQLQRRMGEVPRDREVLVICEHGVRSAQVVKFLRQRLGLTQAINVTGGTERWERLGLPMERAR